MKKKFVFSSVLTLLTIFSLGSASFASGNNNEEPTSRVKLDRLTTLIIDADVTVVLLKNDYSAAALNGSEKFSKNVILRKTGDTLVIGYVKNRNYKEKGIVYVSANQLKNIRINSAANVRTYEALRIPKLDVVINGACEFAISNIGDLNLTGTKFYDFEQTVQTRKIPSGVLQD